MEVEDFSLQQAYTVLQYHVTEPGGLLDQVDRGLPIEKDLKDDFSQLERAFKKVQSAWEQQVEVPKHIVHMFSGVFPRIDARMQLHPEELELREVYLRFSHWIEHLFTPGDPDENYAIAVVTTQVLGVSSISLDLHHRQGLDQPTLGLFFDALDDLAHIWQTRENVSRLAAGSMIIAQDIFISQDNGHTGRKMQEIVEARKVLAEKVENCLQ
ncbi:hypothetical protein ccbrp13_30190 [Ktedonobacteria bacterium brp13]|nr:hypothetical protein ccbrp13_30190 [Ktedonobacteria bacterium brp13]